MKKIVVADADGEIVRLFVVADEDVDANLDGATNYVEIELTDNPTRWTHYVAAGALVAYTTEQAAAKANVPSGLYAWSNSTMSWVDMRTLADAKAQKWAEIRVARDAEIDGGYSFVWGSDTINMPSTEVHRQRLTMFVVLSIFASDPSTFTVDLEQADETTIEFNSSMLVYAAQALGDHINAATDTANALKADIEAATTNAEVDAITWP
jgi:hypothetical protein